MDGYLWGEGWLLVKRNEREAVIEHHSLYMLQELSSSNYRILSFWQPRPLEEDDDTMKFFSVAEMKMPENWIHAEVNIRANGRCQVQVDDESAESC